MRRVFKNFCWTGHPRLFIMSHRSPSGSPLLELANAASFKFCNHRATVVRHSPGSSDDASADSITEVVILRKGKNPNEEKSQTQTQTQTTDYSSRSYSGYESAETNTRPATESVAGTKAFTESETIAREIKDGTLSGFVGSG